MSRMREIVLTLPAIKMLQAPQKRRRRPMPWAFIDKEPKEWLEASPVELRRWISDSANAQSDAIRKRKPDELYPSDSEDEEMMHLREKKRRLEDLQPYNQAAARREAREIGIDEARRSSISKVLKAHKKLPRPLSIDGESSSEFVSEMEAGEQDVGENMGGGAADADPTRTDDDKENVDKASRDQLHVEEKKKRRHRKRPSKKKAKIHHETTAEDHKNDTMSQEDARALKKQKRRLRKKMLRKKATQARRERAAALEQERT